MKLVLLPRGGQRAISGQVINFPSPMENISDQLPRPAEDGDIVYVQQPEKVVNDVQQDKPKTMYYQCRYSKVMNALRWLKENNPLYSDVKVTTPSVNTFPQEEMKDEESIEESGIVRNNILLPDISVPELMKEAVVPVYQMEKITSAPLSIFNEPQMELMAFPTLYVDGKNGFGMYQSSKISPLDYFQARIMSSDARWVQHAAFLFWACNIVEAYKLQSSISIAMRLRNPASQKKKDQKGQFIMDQKQLTAGDLRGTSMEENPDVHENCYSFMRDIRGTAAYWQSTKIQLFAMLRTLGPPTFFITFSADDHHWKDLTIVLAKCTGRVLSEADVDQLSQEEKRQLMTSNPVVTARHFAHRFQCMVREVIKGSAKPIGEVVDFFWRIEFQLRGSPHVHSLWWTKDAPNLDTIEGRQSAPDFIDKFITVAVPEKDHDEDELRTTVLRVQQHNHTATCKKTSKGKTDCRFDFPRPLSSETRLKTNQDVGNKSRFYVLKRKEGEENINAYNPALLLAWQANMDIQMIGSVYGTASYICSYMCKGESEEVKKAIRDSINSLPPQASIRTKLSKLGNTMLSHRQLSGQEAAY